MVENIITVGALAPVVIEGLKWLFRKFVFKDMGYDFPEFVYVIGIPMIELLLQPLLVWLEVIPPLTDPFSIKTVVIVLLQSLITLVGYNQGIKPLKEYALARRSNFAVNNLDIE